MKKLFLLFTLLFTGINCAKQPHTFAVIGDYGQYGPHEKAVADMVKSWQPEYIITTGDNNYVYGEASKIDSNIGQYYHEYIGNYKGIFGAGSAENRFFPSLGNHDWYQPNAQPYLDYFTLPGNERYYDFVKSNIHFFAIDSDPHEPDSTSASSVQAMWLKNKLQSAPEKWKIVYFHHAPFTSGTQDGPTPGMNWPFKEWGASIILSGHEHNYERLFINGMTYIIDGLGGRSLYPLAQAAPGSIVRYDKNYGALQVMEFPDSLVFTFTNIAGEQIDHYTLTK